jgi:hypothetical protein
MHLDALTPRYPFQSLYTGLILVLCISDEYKFSALYVDYIILLVIGIIPLNRSPGEFFKTHLAKVHAAEIVYVIFFLSSNTTICEIRFYS